MIRHIRVWQEFETGFEKRVTRAMWRSGFVPSSEEHRIQIVEDCKSYLGEKLKEIDRNYKKRKDRSYDYRKYVLISLSYQLKYYFGNEKYDYKLKNQLLEDARTLPIEEFYHKDKTMYQPDWSDFDFSGLSKKELEVVCYRYLGRKSFEWIAKKFKTNINNIYQIHNRIRKKLRNEKNQELYISVDSGKDIALLCSADEQKSEI